MVTLKRSLSINGKKLEIEVTIYSEKEYDTDITGSGVTLQDAVKVEAIVKRLIVEQTRYSSQRRPSFHPLHSASA